MGESEREGGGGRGVLRKVALGVLVVALIAAARLLPIEEHLERFEQYVSELGPLGLLLFGAVYVVAALLFVPGSALTVSAGALFGLLRGTVLVSIASTTAAALAYLIARHLARGRVESMARDYPKFAAVDRAIGERGWRIVLLLRLSPIFPYSASNYLYGLTAVRFWPLVLASWVGMLPGTFLYVYLGHAGRAGIEGERTTEEWVFLGVGLAATVLVTVLVTRIAVRALRNVEEVEA